jgi:hypothetical protein
MVAILSLCNISFQEIEQSRSYGMCMITIFFLKPDKMALPSKEWFYKNGYIIIILTWIKKLKFILNVWLKLKIVPDSWKWIGFWKFGPYWVQK